MRSFILLFTLALSTAASASGIDPFFDWKKISLSINDSPFSLYVADTPDRHTQGLMHVSHLPMGHGMLFDFGKSETHCMWMKNTLIPLKVIFLDESGKVLNDVDMTPHDLTPHCSVGNSRYAIEVNKNDPALTKQAIK